MIGNMGSGVRGSRVAAAVVGLCIDCNFCRGSGAASLQIRDGRVHVQLQDDGGKSLARVQAQPR